MKDRAREGGIVGWRRGEKMGFRQSRGRVLERRGREICNFAELPHHTYRETNKGLYVVA